MAHFAQIDENNIVTQVIVVGNSTLNDLPYPDSEPIGIDFCRSLLGQNTNWKQTSYNANFRKNYAGIGFTYDSVLDAFIPPKLFPTWILNTETCQWEIPIPYPEDGKDYRWNEETQSWELISEN